MNNLFKKLICLILLLLIIFSVIYIIKYSFDIYNTKKESNLLENISINEVENNEIIASQEENVVVPTKTSRMLELEELQKENSDIVAWIEIENTDINYPVLQGSDNTFYSNLLIYGHNNKNNTMFQNLLKYKDKNFYEQHQKIRFTTNSEDAYYDIISAFESRVYYKSEQNVFRYYYFINSNNENEYNNFISNVKNASLYDTKKTATYGEQLMTLSTCAYHVKDGRFAVVAKKASVVEP